jgi:hypothetical protein
MGVADDGTPYLSFLNKNANPTIMVYAPEEGLKYQF